jgi:hypothetical protein
MHCVDEWKPNPPWLSGSGNDYLKKEYTHRDRQNQCMWDWDNL